MHALDVRDPLLSRRLTGATTVEVGMGSSAPLFQVVSDTQIDVLGRLRGGPRRRPGAASWIPDVSTPNWQAGNTFTWQPVQADVGTWEPWAYGNADLLLGVAVGETEVVPVQAVPAVLEQHWYKFCALHRLWTQETALAAAGPALRPVPPPPLREQA